MRKICMSGDGREIEGGEMLQLAEMKDAEFYLSHGPAYGVFASIVAHGGESATPLEDRVAYGAARFRDYSATTANAELRNRGMPEVDPDRSREIAERAIRAGGAVVSLAYSSRRNLGELFRVQYSLPDTKHDDPFSLYYRAL